MARTATRKLRCYAEGTGGQWEALCLDLDIAVSGPSFEAVYHDLNKAIGLYVARAMALPAPERARLLGRRAPWHVRAGAILKALHVALFGDRQDGDRETHGYTLPCPA